MNDEKDEFNIVGELKVVIYEKNDELYLLEQELLEIKDLVEDFAKLTNSQTQNLKYIEVNTEIVDDQVERSIENLQISKNIVNKSMRIYKILAGTIVGTVLGASGLWLGVIPGLVTLLVGASGGGGVTALITKN